MRVLSNSDSHGVLLPEALAWAAFDGLSPRIQRVVQEAGINISPIEVYDRVSDLRKHGKTDAEIERWLTEALKLLTHQKYLQAGHPQFRK